MPNAVCPPFYSIQSMSIALKFLWGPPVHHSPLPHTWSFCCLHILPFPECPIAGIIQYIAFSDWLFPCYINNMPLSFLPDVQAGFRKGRRTRDQIANIQFDFAGSSKKQESSQKTSISALLTMSKPLTVWITINCGKFWKRWEYQTTWPASWETYMQVRKQQLELDMEQQTGSK